MKTFLIATRNAHKVGEIRAILSDRFSYLTLRDFPTARAVVEDALRAALAAAKLSPALSATDS